MALTRRQPSRSMPFAAALFGPIFFGKSWHRSVTGAMTIWCVGWQCFANPGLTVHPTARFSVESRCPTYLDLPVSLRYTLQS